MTNQDKLNLFDSAILVMAQHAALYARGDVLTRKHSAFRSFDNLLQCNRNYRPSINMATPEKREFADLYDAAQTARGDVRRAYRFGNVKRKGSIIDRENWNPEEQFYKLRDRVAWYDKRSKQWIVYTVCEQGYQQGSAEFYYRADDLLACEHAH